MIKNIVRTFLAVAAISALTTTRQAVAQVGGDSDEMIISSPAGVVFDTVIPEGNGPNTEQELIWDPSGALVGPPGLVPAGSLTGLGFISPAALAGFTFVILSEPAGEPADPNELPPATYITPNGPIVVSDILFNGLNSVAFQQGQLPPLIGFLSDNNIDLNNLVAILPAGVPVVAETGALQDLTALMGSNIVNLSAFGGPVFPVTVQVRSDAATPEPSTIALAGMGLIALVPMIRRRLRKA